jgi:hypothetical protein
MILPAISIKQPWAWAILNAGKDVENRSWPLPTKYAVKHILIHTGKRIEQDAVIHLRHLGYKVPHHMKTGGIVGITRFRNSVFDAGKSDWAEQGFHHWPISISAPLTFFP